MRFSVIIVNLNGKRYLNQCLKSVLKNNYKNFEIIIVDNHSTDGSLDYIPDTKIKVIRLTKNFGPAYARNQAAKQATGQILAFLDNDTEVDPNWLVEAEKEFHHKPKIGCIQSKLLLLDHKNKFDYAGDYLNQFGLLTHRATYGDLDTGQFDQKAIIFAAKSAGMFIRKNVFIRIGGFDDKYFIYMEETDLCWRSWLSGYQTLYLPTSVVYHGFSGSFKLLNQKLANYNLFFHGTKNYILTNIKNLSFPNLVFVIPKQLFIYFIYSFYLLLFNHSPINFLLIHRAIIWNITHIRQTLSIRHQIQNSRVLSDKQLFSYIYKKISIIEKINKSILLKTN